MSSENTGRISRLTIGCIVLAVVVGVGAGGAGTYAYLTDTGETALSLTTGSIVITNDPGTLSFPTDDGTEKTATVTVRNEGTLPARQLSLSSVSISGANGTTVAKASKITAVEYNGTDITGDLESTVGDANGNGIFDLDDVRTHLENGEYVLSSDDVALEPGESVQFTVSVVFDYSQPGMTANEMEMGATVEFTGAQEAAA